MGSSGSLSPDDGSECSLTHVQSLRAEPVLKAIEVEGERKVLHELPGDRLYRIPAHSIVMLAAGVHLRVVSERLGHSTIGITADLHTHVAEEVHEASAPSLDAFLGSSVTSN